MYDAQVIRKKQNKLILECRYACHETCIVLSNFHCPKKRKSKGSDEREKNEVYSEGFQFKTKNDSKMKFMSIIKTITKGTVFNRSDMEQNGSKHKVYDSPNKVHIFGKFLTHKGSTTIFKKS